MRIAVDARPLLGPRTGVGVWLEGLLQRLAQEPHFTLELHLPRFAALCWGSLPPLPVRAPRLPMPGTLWLHTWAWKQTAEADLFLATLGVLPRHLRCPGLVVLHDLTPRTVPQHHTWANRFCFNAYVQESLLAARALVCDSHATAARLRQLFPGHGEQLEVLPPGVDEFFCPGEEDVEALRARFAQGRPFLLQLGTLEPRKGADTLVRAHGLLLRRNPTAPDLVLAGGKGWGGNFLQQALAEHPERHRVHLPGYVSREEARGLLRTAEVVVLASEEEGFGLPLAEALACGAACVATDAEALVEVAGGAAIHVPRRNPEALAQALAQALELSWNQKLRLLALERAPFLRWDRVLPRWRELLLQLGNVKA